MSVCAAYITHREEREKLLKIQVQLGFAFIHIYYLYMEFFFNKCRFSSLFQLI